MQDKKIIVISGLSGSGKSVALQSLEDIGFYCIDNMPLTLLGEFTRQFEKASNQQKRAAISIDSRNLDFLKILNRASDANDLKNDSDQLIFLEANQDTLLRRFSETRRKHPLSNSTTTLAQSIEKEITLLSKLRDAADHIVDTSTLTPHELREKIRLLAGRAKQGVMLSIESFGFKHGPPQHADFIFDVRCLPNPYWDESIRELSGMDTAVIDFLNAKPGAKQMCNDIAEFILKWLPAFEADNRSYLTVAIGCTGGRHRSVYTVNCLAEKLKRKTSNVQTQHRDL